MVAIPGIKDSFRHACRYRSGLLERGLSVVCFPSGVGIKRLHVHGPPWFPILLRTYDHSVAVCHWVTNAGTGSITPSRTSRSNPALTSSCQRTGTGTGMWWATGAASWSTMSLSGGPCIMGSS